MENSVFSDFDSIPYYRIKLDRKKNAAESFSRGFVTMETLCTGEKEVHTFLALGY